MGLGPLSDPGTGLGPRSNDGGAPWYAACAPPCTYPPWSEAAEASGRPERSEHRLDGERRSGAGELSLCRWLGLGLACRGSCDWATPPQRSLAEPWRGTGPWPGRGRRSGEALALPPG